MIGIESEVVQRAPANRIRVLVLRKSFAIPSYRAGSLSDIPGSAVVALAVKCAVICPAGVLRRRVESYIADVHSGGQRYTKRLDTAVEVLVVEGIFIVPHSWGWVSHFVAHKPNTVIARVGLDLAHHGTPT